MDDFKVNAEHKKMSSQYYNYYETVQFELVILITELRHAFSTKLWLWNSGDRCT